MSIDLTAEILATHADQLNRERTVRAETFLESYPDQPAELVALLDMAVRVHDQLPPVKPDPAFRARLRDGLVRAAHHRHTQNILIERRGEPQWGWLLGAAAVGSAAGLLAIVWRTRGQDHSVAALGALTSRAE